MLPNRWSWAATLLLASSMIASAASAAPMHLATDIPGTALVPLAVLPPAPKTPISDEGCSGYAVAPSTPAGHEVVRRGWTLTSEAALGAFTVVTFAGSLSFAGSAVCFAQNSNLGIFAGASLVALAYTNGKESGVFGEVQPLESGAVQIKNGARFGPLGELHEENGGFRLTDLAPERTFCGRRVHVPNIYNNSIDVARRILIAHGWRPVPRTPEPDEIDVAVALAKAGVVEAEHCWPTGWGFCRFNYRAPSGALQVETVGGDASPASNVVVSIGVTCDDPR